MCFKTIKVFRKEINGLDGCGFKMAFILNSDCSQQYTLANLYVQIGYQHCKDNIFILAMHNLSYTYLGWLRISFNMK
ncbi:hypothetical protein C0J52_00144 [Blattella germanica]|nr:hypothetical protein C0J52_00144 [Blattella germanica]